LAGIMGINSMNVVATATAALTGTGTLLPGEANAPFGFDEQIFNDPAYCSQQIHFFPTTTSCAGFQTFDQNANANNMKNILEGLASNPAYIAPQIIAGQTDLNYTGGSLGNAAFTPLINLFNLKKVNDPEAPAPYTQCWKVTIPVYKNFSCGNPSGEMLTVGFASACVFNVQGVPTQAIDAKVTCNQVTSGGGGGGNFGTLGAIPGLVE
jgi:hypothetical protein